MRDISAMRRRVWEWDVSEMRESQTRCVRLGRSRSPFDRVRRPTTSHLHFIETALSCTVICRKSQIFLPHVHLAPRFGLRTDYRLEFHYLCHQKLQSLNYRWCLFFCRTPTLVSWLITRFRNRVPGCWNRVTRIRLYSIFFFLNSCLLSWFLLLALNMVGLHFPHIWLLINATDKWMNEWMKMWKLRRISFKPMFLLSLLTNKDSYNTQIIRCVNDTIFRKRFRLPGFGTGSATFLGTGSYVKSLSNLWRKDGQ